MARHRRAFLALEWGLYTLPAANLCLFFATAAPFEALDGLGWMLLLAVFEWESTCPDRPHVPPFEKAALRAMQAIVYGLASYACWRYWQEDMWADVANAALWIAVVAAMTCEVENPARLSGVGEAGR